MLCRAAGSALAWGVHRSSGLFIATFFDADNRLEAIEFAGPHGKDDAVTYLGLDIFATPAADLVTQLRQHITIQQDENGNAFTATSVLLSLSMPVTPESPDQQGRFFDNVFIATPGFYDQLAEPDASSQH